MRGGTDTRRVDQAWVGLVLAASLLTEGEEGGRVVPQFVIFFTFLMLQVTSVLGGGQIPTGLTFWGDLSE